MKHLYKYFSLIILGLLSVLVASAQDNYRTIATGNWSGAAVWQKDVAGNGVYSSTATPPTAANSISITIMSGHTVTVTASTDADSLTVASGGILIVNASQVFTVQNGTGVDMQVSGTVTNNGTITLAASSVSRVGGTVNNLGSFTNASATTLFFDAGSTYDHKFTTTAGTIPTASWDVNSTCQVTGYTSNTTAPSGLSQAFGNFTWNVTNYVGGIYFELNGAITNISGNLSVMSTGTNQDGLAFFSTGTGNLTVAKTFSVCCNAYVSIGTNAASSVTLTCQDFQISGVSSTTLELNDAAGTGVLVVKGNFSATSGTVQGTGTSGTITFKGSSVQNYISGLTYGTPVNFIVDTNAILNFGTSNILEGSGNLTVRIGGAIQLGSTHSSGAYQPGNANGNIQTLGTRTFNVGSKLVYNGSSAQFLGTSLPANANVEINNSNGVSLSTNTTITSTLILTSGNLNLNLYTLTIGSSASAIGALSRSAGNIFGTGTFTRWFNTNTIAAGSDSGLFPITITPDTSRFVWLSGTPTTGGTLTVAYTNAYGATNYGSPFSDGGITVDRRTNLYWTLTTGNGLAGSAFGLRLRAKGIPAVANVSDLRISLSTAIAQGTSSNGTGSTSIPEANRTGLTAANLNNSFYISSASSSNPLMIASLSNNTISGTQTICSGSTPSSVTGSSPAGGDGTYTYSWLSSTISATSGFALASGTNNAISYTPGTLSLSIWYRRLVTSAGYTDTSAAVAVTVNTAVATNSITGTPQTICNGSTPASITASTPTGGDGSTYTYSWLSSTTGATSGFAAAGGTNNTINYAPGTLSLSTWFRRRVTSGVCNADTTTAVQITVNPVIATNTGSGTQSICSGSTPTSITGSTPTGGSGVYTYSWLSSTTGATSGFAVASGTSNAINYSPGTLSLSTWYRRLVTSGGCSDTSVAVAVTVNSVLATNTGSGTQTICSGSSPSGITGSTPTGGSGAYTYSWLSSTTSATSGFAVASGTNNTISYSPGTLSQSTWYRRLVTSGGCADTSVAVAITVNTAVAGNTASGAQTICNGSAPSALTGSTPTGGTGVYTYSWLSSTTSATSGFAPASGTNNAINYAPGSLSLSTWFRRKVVSGVCNADTTTAVQITVNPVIATNTGSGTQSICSGSTPTTITGSTPTGGSGVYTYSWLSSTTGATSGFAVASGTNNSINYAPGTLSLSTWYRRLVTSGGCSDTSVAVAVTVNSGIATNTGSGTQTICSGSTPSGITGSTPTGGSGVYTYSWLSSTTSGTSGFAVASGTNNAINYAPGTLSQTTWYRRLVTSGGCADTSVAVAITINTAVAGNTASGVQTICNGSTPSALTGSTPIGGTGVYTYSWLSSTTSATSGFAPASGTNNSINYAPGSLTLNTWFRRKVVSGVCNADTTTAVQITVNPVIATNTGSGTQSICSGSTPASITGSTPTGGGGVYTYSWLSSTTGATTGFAVASGTNNAISYSPGTLSLSTWYRRLVTSGGCSDTSVAVSVTVNSGLANNTVGGGSLICNGSTSSLTGSTPTGGSGIYTYSWLSSTTSATSGFAVASGTNNTQNYTSGSLSTPTWFRRYVTSSGCADTSSATHVTISNTNTWTGTTSTAWATATNWSCGVIPTSVTNVIINSGTPNMPTVSDARFANNITVNNAATLTVTDFLTTGKITVNTGATLILNNTNSAIDVNDTFLLSGTLTHTNGKVQFTNLTTAQPVPGAVYYNLVFNNSNGLVLTGNATVNNNVDFTRGAITLGNNNLTLTGASSTITNAAASKYFVTNGSGSLNIQNIGTGGKTGGIVFPVGNASYNPVTLTNTGTADEFRARVFDSVTTDYSGSAAIGTKLTSNAVGKTWIVNEAIAGGSNATVTLQWNTTDELSGFNRSLSYVSRYDGITWLSTTAAAATGANPYTQTRTGITAFSPFGVGSGGTLPVELLSFTAQRKSSTVDLKWTTASELNNNHFEIERTEHYAPGSGHSWEVIGNVKGMGSTNSLSNYQFSDDLNTLTLPHSNTLYYRLKQVDFDGNFTYSEIAAIKMVNDKIDITVYPNPVKNNLSISINHLTEKGGAIIDILDMSGKLIKQALYTINDKDVILSHECSDLQNGIYFIHIYSNKFSVYSKLIKE